MMSIHSTCRSFSRNYKLLIILITMVQLIGSSCSPTGEQTWSLSWHTFPEIPPPSGESVQPGLAGPVTGAHANFALVAGGANFEGGLPWRGGKKKYHDDIFLLEKTASGNDSWKQLAEKLPYPMAYPACVSTSEGVVSIGGEDPDGPVADVFLFSFQDGKVSRSSLPALPQAVSSAGAAAIGNELFVVGGLVASGATAAFYSLDMKNAAKGWRALPEIPEAFSHAVIVSQMDENEMCIYVMGGRNKTSEVSTFLSSIWKYTPSIQKWSLEGDIISGGEPLALSAGTGMAVGSNQILLFGGDPGIFFNRTERMNAALEKVSGEEERQKLWQEKDSMLTNHPGFSNEILAYNTLSKRWESMGTIAGESPVTTAAFSWNGTIVIPSGEVRPGVRTPMVIGVDIQVEK